MELCNARKPILAVFLTGIQIGHLLHRTLYFHRRNALRQLDYTRQTWPPIRTVKRGENRIQRRGNYNWALLYHSAGPNWEYEDPRRDGSIGEQVGWINSHVASGLKELKEYELKNIGIIDSRTSFVFPNHNQLCQLTFTFFMLIFFVNYLLPSYLFIASWIFYLMSYPYHS